MALPFFVLREGKGMHYEEASRRAIRRAIGGRIRALREAKGLSVPDLAELSAVPEMEIGMLENGKRSVRFETLLCLAGALGASPTSLFEAR